MRILDNRKLTRKISGTAYSLFMAALALLCLFPLFFAVLASLKSSTEIFSSPFDWPKAMRWENYSVAWKQAHIGQYFINTIFLTAASMIISAIVCLLGAYALARFKFRMNKALYMIFISGMMIPIQITIIPLAYVFGALGVTNNYPVIILLFTAFNIPMSMLILTGFLKEIPKELEEAAIIDGCSATRILFSVFCPVAMPAIASASIFNFIGVWNNLLIPLVFIDKVSMKTISIGLLSFIGTYSADYGGMMAAIVIAISVPVTTYVFLQEKVERGLISGSIKG
jgi:raffinose/stachyose/melibiose transport system permease protein